MPRFVTRGCVICQPQWSVLICHYVICNPFNLSIFTIQPGDWSPVLSLISWSLPVPMVPKEFGKQRIPNDESSGCRTSLVASTIQHFLQHNISKAKYCWLWRTCCLLFIYCLLFLDVVMWWIFECQKNTRRIENHFGTVTLALEEPKSFFQYLDFATLRTYVDFWTTNTIDPLLGELLPKNSRVWQNLRDSMGQLHPIQKFCLYPEMLIFHSFL